MNDRRWQQGNSMRTLLNHPRFGVRRVWKSCGLALALVPSLIICLPPLALASGGCPLTLIRGEGGRNGITVTFRNDEKVPIRRLEFSCKLAHGSASKASQAVCSEENAMFFSATPYTVNYGYPGGIAKAMVVSVKSVTLADGHVWKPSRHATCRVLRITPSQRRADQK
jgi:hypothetical protein